MVVLMTMLIGVAFVLVIFGVPLVIYWLDRQQEKG